jgi:hypothetical protein
MSTPSQESLKYRNKSYFLIGAPLSPYLQANKEIEFDYYSSAHHRGYQGYWLLESNKLYLINIESRNYTMTDLFQSEKPVFAEWYNGQLEFGIGNCYSDGSWWGVYDNYVWLSIKNGKVIKKRIIKRFTQEPELSFGRYQGRKFKDILNGKIERNIYTTIKDFIAYLLEFLKNSKCEFKVLCPRFKIEKIDGELVKEIQTFGIDYFLTQNYIAISSKVFWENSNKDERGFKMSKLLEKILASDFTKLFTLTKQKLESAEIAEQTILINPDIQYLNWALKTVDSFAVPPDLLKRDFSIKQLRSLKLNRLNDLIFEYEPVMETINYKFPENILKINQEKFEKINNVRHEPRYNFFLLNLTDKELIKKFGYFLDEDYIVHKNNDYRYDRDDWLRDAAGTNDPETMNDTYWNLD